MKNKKIFLDLDDDEPINIGLLRLIKKIPDYEMFFEMNKINTYKFSRIEDLKVKKFYFSRYQTYHPETKTIYQIISNKSASVRIKTSNELFAQAEEIKYLLPKNKDVDFIFYAKDSVSDFSLFLLPENFLFKIQEFYLEPRNELYKLIQYYE